MEYTTEEMIDYSEELLELSGTFEKAYFINLGYGRNQAMIVSYDHSTGKFIDYSRKYPRKFTPEEILNNTVTTERYNSGKYFVHVHRDRWAKIKLPFFTLAMPNYQEW